MQKILSGIELRPPELEEEEIGVDLPPDHPLLPSFVYLLVGGPGSGKSYLMKELVTNSKMYRKKFEEVIIISPNQWRSLEVEYGQDWYSTFSLDWIYAKIKDLRKQYFSEDDKTFTYHKNVNILFVIDDVVSEIKQQQSDKRLKDLIWNRRHYFDDAKGILHGTISFLFTTQKYTQFPSTIRSQINGLLFFKVPNNDYKIMKEEYFAYNSKALDYIVSVAFKEKHNFIYIKTFVGLVYIKFDQVIL